MSTTGKGKVHSTFVGSVEPLPIGLVSASSLSTISDQLVARTVTVFGCSDRKSVSAIVFPFFDFFDVMLASFHALQYNDLRCLAVACSHTVLRGGLGRFTGRFLIADRQL